MHAQIEIYKGWLAQEELLMQRLAAIISGPFTGCDPHNTPPYKKENSNRYQLDNGNDYFGEIKEGKLELDSRYDGPRFDTLVEFCKVWLGPKF